jgi:PAS domain S-box-containing protein
LQNGEVAAKDREDRNQPDPGREESGSMNSLGVLTLLAAGLQLTVPSYALRLVHRFGAQRVGWFIVTAFFSLAVLHAVKPPRAFPAGPRIEAASNLVFIAASVLLLVGMGHVETLCKERLKEQAREEKRRREWEADIQEQSAQLSQANQRLAHELASREHWEQELRESLDQFRLLFAENPQPMWILDPRTGGFLEVNQAALRQYGFTREEFLGLSLLDLVHGQPRNIGADAGEPERRSLSHRRKDQTVIEVETQARDIKFGARPARLVVATDVSARQRRDRESLEHQRVKIVSQVAGGVAHHFNNLLTIVSCEANLLLRNQTDLRALKALNQICDAVKRAGGLTGQLMAVAAREPMQAKNVDLNAVLRKLDPMLRRLTGERIRFRTECGATVPFILADPRLLERVIVSLVLNSRDAMPNGGHLTLSTTAIRADSRMNNLRAGVNAGVYARLSVRDTGHGISPEIQARLFEPFFTTHDVGRGFGLGLASVQGTVRQHGGWVEYTTDPCSGSEFQVYLPSAVAEDLPAHPPACEATFLLAEPEDSVRSVACVG